MPLYSHVASLAFRVLTVEADGSDLTPAALRAAVVARLDELDDLGDWERAFAVHDTVPVPSRDAGSLPRTGSALALPAAAA